MTIGKLCSADRRADNDLVEPCSFQPKTKTSRRNFKEASISASNVEVVMCRAIKLHKIFGSPKLPGTRKSPAAQDLVRVNAHDILRTDSRTFADSHSVPLPAGSVAFLVELHKT